MTYTTPNLTAPEFFDGLLDEYNTLIAGCVGSGKSTVIEGIIYSIACNFTPEDAEVYLIDPKMVQLDPWRVIPHCAGYADTIEGANDIMEEVKERMERRYRDIKNRHIREFDGSHIYVIIDELADLLMEDKKGFPFLLRKVLQLGRAARVHVIGATQSVRREIVNGALQVNFTCRVGLHCSSVIESRIAIEQPGCETLPPYGKAILKHNGRVDDPVEVPYVNEKQCETVRQFWLAQIFAQLAAERNANVSFN